MPNGILKKDSYKNHFINDFQQFFNGKWNYKKKIDKCEIHWSKFPVAPSMQCSRLVDVTHGYPTTQLTNRHRCVISVYLALN